MAAQRDLARLAEIDDAVGGAAQLSALYVGCQLLLERVLASRLWASPAALASQEGNMMRTTILQLLQDCLKLQHLFTGMSDEDFALIKQFKVKVLAVQLVYIVRCSNLSALALCEHFLEQVEDIQRHLGDKMIEPEPFTASLLKELSMMEETKPRPVANCLMPLLQNVPPLPQLHPTTSVHMTKVSLTKPVGDMDALLKFTAGLVLGIPLDAELLHLRSMSALRIKVRYPDQQVHLLVPKRTDLRPM